MSDVAEHPWAWAEDHWHRAFAPLIEAGYRLERLESSAYWQLHEVEMRAHFPPEVYVNTIALRTEAERAGLQRLDEARGARPLRDHCAIRRDGRLVGLFCGHQHQSGAYRMHHSHVHPAFRNRGVYGPILQGTIAYTKELGFDSIVSEHAACNNAVLIAKLKAGFHTLTRRRCATAPGSTGPGSPRARP